MNAEQYKAHPKMFRNYPIYFIFFIFLIPLYGLGLLLLLIWYLKCLATTLVVTDSELMWEQGLLSKQRTELNLNKIRTVSVKQSLQQRMFGTGNIEIYTAGDSPEIVLTGLPRPMELRTIIKKGMT